MTPNLSALLERVEAEKTGGNRRLDVMIHATFAPADFPDDDADHYATYPSLNRADMRYLNEMLIPPYTASIDAALALVEKKLPGQWPNILRTALSTLSKRHWWHTDHAKDSQRKELPAAILAALLRALSQGAGHEQ